MNQECLVGRLCWFLPHCHLHQRADEHRNSLSSTGKHFRDKHSLAPKDLARNFCVLMDCTNKFDCLIYEVFFYSRTETCNRNLIVRRLLISSSFFFRLLIRLLCIFFIACLHSWFFLYPSYTLHIYSLFYLLSSTWQWPKYGRDVVFLPCCFNVEFKTYIIIQIKDVYCTEKISRRHEAIVPVT